MKNKPYKIEIKEVVDDYVVMSVYENEHKPYPTERIVIKPYDVYIENKKLNNIIKELGKYLIEQVEKSYSNDYDNVLDKLDELKGSDNNK